MCNASFILSSSSNIASDVESSAVVVIVEVAWTAGVAGAVEAKDPAWRLSEHGSAPCCQLDQYRGDTENRISWPHTGDG